MSEERVRIVSDGTWAGTEVTGADGQDIPRVESLCFHLDWDKRELPKATLNVLLPTVDVTAEAEYVTTLPNGKQYKLVEIEEDTGNG